MKQKQRIKYLVVRLAAVDIAAAIVLGIETVLETELGLGTEIELGMVPEIVAQTVPVPVGMVAALMIVAEAGDAKHH